MEQPFLDPTGRVTTQAPPPPSSPPPHNNSPGVKSGVQRGAHSVLNMTSGGRRCRSAAPLRSPSLPHPSSPSPESSNICFQVVFTGHRQEQIVRLPRCRMLNVFVSSVALQSRATFNQKHICSYLLFSSLLNNYIYCSHILNVFSVNVQCGKLERLTGSTGSLSNVDLIFYSNIFFFFF